MKTITIGRGEGCDIQIDHNNISRRHAILKVYTFGKMEIVDMGQNGTWVNGVKLRPGVPFPVKRKDVVNFAEVSQLNWSRVPNPTKYLKLVVYVSVLLLLFIVAVCLIFSNCPSNSYETNNSSLPSITSEVSSEGNVSNTIEDGQKQSPVSSRGQGETKEKQGEKSEKDKTVIPGSKSGEKSADELFPFVNKTKKDSIKKESGKKKEEEKEKKVKDKKSEKPSQKVDVIL